MPRLAFDPKQTWLETAVAGPVREGVESYLAGGDTSDPTQQRRMEPGPVEKGIAGALPLVNTSVEDIAMPAQVGPLFHGSGKVFKKFANEAIGTGEGAQAFGWGHYLSEGPGIAKSYRRNTVEFAGLTDHKALDYFTNLRDMEGILEELAKKPTNKELRKQLMAELKTSLDDIQHERKAWLAAPEQKRKQPNPEELKKRLALLDGEEELANRMLVATKNGKNPTFTRGPLYTVTLHKGKKVGEYEYLEWDKPLTVKQKELIAPVVKFDTTKAKFGNWMDEIGLAPASGEEAYKKLAEKLGSPKAASEFLSRAGISGIKYPAGTLSGWGQQKILKFGGKPISPNDPSHPYIDYMQKSLGSNPKQASMLDMLENELAEKVHFEKYQRATKPEYKDDQISIVEDLIKQVKSGASLSIESKPRKYNYVVFNPDDIHIERVFKGRQK